MHARILGPLAVEVAGSEIAFAGPRQRAVLAYLLLEANQPVPADRMVADLWGEESTPRTANALQQAIRRLRAGLPGDRLLSSPAGYSIRVDFAELDAARFERGLRAGREALNSGDTDRAWRHFDEALSEWRGDALVEFRYEDFAQPEIARLEALHLDALEARAACALATGRIDGLAAELTELLAKHPHRDNLRAHLMVALTRVGEQERALAIYEERRMHLRDELGLDVPQLLQQIQQGILRQDPSLLREAPTRDLAPRRQPITVVCAELASDSGGSDSDIEARDTLLEGATTQLDELFQQHGGLLNTFVGRHAIGVFGLARLHEDDPARAISAAYALTAGDRHHSTQWSPLRTRCGVVTGEALVGGPSHKPLAPDLVDRAIGLAGQAQYGEVLVEAETARLAGSALLGLSQGTHVRLVSARPGTRPLPLRLDGPLVGREHHLHRLQEVLARAETLRTGQALAVVGDAGIGKSRILLELAKERPEFRFVSSRCSAYGESTTLYPLKQLLEALPPVGLEPRRIAAKAGKDPEAERIGSVLATVAAGGGGERLDQDQVRWALRRLLEAAATSGPLAVVVDDVHWASDTLRGLLNSLLTPQLRGPIALILAGRPEVLDGMPWDVALGFDRLELPTLDDAQAGLLLDTIVGPAAVPGASRADLVEACGGNPLFLEQLVAWARERPLGSPLQSLPPSLRGLLFSRIHDLGPAEREVLDRAAVIGRSASSDILAALLPEDLRRHQEFYTRRLASRGLLGIAEPVSGPARLLFRHALIHQVAYSSVTRSMRATLHRQVAELLEAKTGHDDADHTLVGFHLEQSCRHTTAAADLGATERAETAEHAAWHLEHAARSSRDLGDLLDSITKFERAADLLVGAPSEARPLIGKAEALIDAGRLAEAEDLLARAEQVAGAGGRQELGGHALVQRLLLTLRTDLVTAVASIDANAPGLLTLFRDREDLRGQSLVWQLRAEVSWAAALAGQAELAWEKATDLARRAGWRSQVAYYLAWLASAALWGPRPVEDGIARVRGYLPAVEAYPVPHAVTCLHLAGLHAMQAEFSVAARLIRRAAEIYEELGASLPAAVREPAAYAAELAGDLPRAEALLRQDYRALKDMGETSYLAVFAARLARVLVRQDPQRVSEAHALAVESREAGGDTDVSARVLSCCAAARVLRAQGQLSRAVAEARTAVTMAQTSDFLPLLGDAFTDLADSLADAGDLPASTNALTQAASVHRRKGNRAALNAIEPRIDSPATSDRRTHTPIGDQR